MKLIHEEFAKFFEAPTRENFRELIQFNTGEFDNIDFKEEWPEKSKLAKHILAIANSKGGIIVVGVKETKEKKLISKGISITDKSEITNQLDIYLPNSIDYNILDLTYPTSEYGEIEGKSFQVMLIEYLPTKIPFISKSEGSSLKKDTIYVRRGTNSFPANYDEIQLILNNRIATNRNTTSEIKLDEHISHLRILYSKIEKYNYIKDPENPGLLSNFNNAIGSISKKMVGERKAIINKNYPDEGFEQFIARMISGKKEKISSVLEV